MQWLFSLSRLVALLSLSRKQAWPKLKMSLENNTMTFEKNAIFTTATVRKTSSHDDDKGVESSTVAVYVCLGIVGCVGNGLVLFFFCSSEKLRTSIVNIYLINQSCIDFVASIFLIASADTSLNISGLSADSLQGEQK